MFAHSLNSFPNYYSGLDGPEPLDWLPGRSDTLAGVPPNRSLSLNELPVEAPKPAIGARDDRIPCRNSGGATCNRIAKTEAARPERKGTTR